MKLSIHQLRKKIDKLDEKIITMLSKRKYLSMKIGTIKAQSGITVVDKEREKKLMLRYEKLSKKHNLQESLVRKLFKLVIFNSRKLQK